MPFQRIAILGCGLIGGSLGLGLKKNGFAGDIVGWERAEIVEKARRRGAIDQGTTELSDAVAEADLIYLATPVVLILELLPQVARHAKPGALVTDAGSTKLRICRLAREVLLKEVGFLGGHPLAGKEVSGIENADSDLFVGAKYVVIGEAQEAQKTEEAKEKADPSQPSLGSARDKLGMTNGGASEEAGEKADSSLSLGMTETVEEFLGWVRRLGAEPVEMDAETHDWALALVSHLPQLLSTALASAVWDETDEDGLPVALAAGGFRDMTRLAGSPYEMWRDICLTNSENLGRALGRLEQKLERLRTHLRSKELAEEFEKAQQLARWLRDASR
ncbi:MAG: prephenate dehydrogenase [Terriglobia bacterium]